MPTPLANTNLFKPIKVGRLTLQNRLVHAPTTRFKCTEDYVATDSMLKYYSQRAQNNGGLIVFEGTYASPEFGPKERVTMVKTPRQIEALGKISRAVHREGTSISIQLTNSGRTGGPDSLTHSKVQSTIKEYAEAARRAVEGAGFDIVEVHTAYGALPGLFLDSASNHRKDEYGGSDESRARFVLETLDAIIDAVGADRTAIRMAAYNGKTSVEGYLVSELERRAQNGNRLAYISLVGGAHGNWVKDIWQGVVLQTGRMISPPDNARLRECVESDNCTLVGSGSYYSSNPDLAERLKKGLELTEYDTDTLYHGSGNEGYATWGKYGEASVFDNGMPRALA